MTKIPTDLQWANLANRIKAAENVQSDWSQTDGTASDYIKNKPTIPSTAADVHALPDTTKYGATLSLSINSTTYVVTATLKDQDGNTLGTAQTIDLPLESVVVNGSYDSATKEVVLTLEGGSTIRFSVADLVSGLQSEITSTNKLSADLVDDTSTTNKFVPVATAGDADKYLKGDGTWDDPTFTLTPATTSALGGVIVGDGLGVTSDGTVSVNTFTSAEWSALWA